MACARALLAATRAVCARVPQGALVGGARAASAAAAAGWEAEMARFWDAKGVNSDKLQRLQELLPGADAAKMVAQQPPLLASDPETLAHKLQRLQELLPEADVAKMVAQQPSLLGRDPETLAHKLQRLQELLPGADAAKMLAQKPFLLTSDPDTRRQAANKHTAELPESNQPLAARGRGAPGFLAAAQWRSDGNELKVRATRVLRIHLSVCLSRAFYSVV